MSQDMENRPHKFKDKAIVLGVPIDNQPIVFFIKKIQDAILRKKQIKIYTPNPEICLKAEGDGGFKHVLETADYNLPDGFGLKLGAKILDENLDYRVCGSDLVKYIIEKFNNQQVYIVLRSDSLTKEADLKKTIDDYRIFYRVGTVDKDRPFDCDKILNEINDFKPQIVFVCLGAPEQEMWIDKYSRFLPDVNVAIGVGGSFDFLTGKIKRAPKVMRENGLEWAYRLYQEPKRLIRIKHAVADFLLKCHEWKRRIKNEYRENVVGVVVNKKGEYLVQKNMRLKDHWQFPQGGVDKGETQEEAVIREVGEEIGTDEQFLKIIKKIPENHVYDWYPYAQKLKGYKGQKQNVFLLEFSGRNSDIDHSDSYEVEEIKWVAKDDIVRSLHPIRREFGEKIVKHL
jgi:N-acetylglucosaminyldiphosphoundecaprenol N-acetyl-beta-D-mannosaminyltransferase